MVNRNPPTPCLHNDNCGMMIIQVYSTAKVLSLVPGGGEGLGTGLSLDH